SVIENIWQNARRSLFVGAHQVRRASDLDVHASRPLFLAHQPEVRASLDSRGLWTEHTTVRRTNRRRSSSRVLNVSGLERELGWLAVGYLNGVERPWRCTSSCLATHTRRFPFIFPAQSPNTDFQQLAVVLSG